jgi:ABC-type nickel/cobalt efflux system permease component RcnA
MSEGLGILALSAAAIAFFHTMLGPDHYLPFIAMSRAQGWSLARTATITTLCGAGHVLSAVLLGAVGIALGLAASFFEPINEIRGSLAAWAFMSFGLAYLAWGLRQARKNTPHSHAHPHTDGHVHDHGHTHGGEHVHVHEDGAKRMTPWVIFVIFVLGPCEPMIPVIMYPAVKGNYLTLIVVTAIFGAVAMTSMLAVVLGASLGLKSVPLRSWDRYSHALAGATLFLCGAAMQFFGL